MEKNVSKDVMRMEDVIRYFSFVCGGDWEEIYKSIKERKEITNKGIEKVNKEIGKSITLVDGRYPKSLREKGKPPFVCYYEGDISLIGSSENCIAVLNDNLSSDYAYKTIEQICLGLVDKVIFVIQFGYKKSNMLIEKIVNKGGKVIAVLDRGIGSFDEEYESLYTHLSKKQLIISEFPKTIKEKNYKTEVNCIKLMIGLSNNVLVGGTTKRSAYNAGIAYAVSNSLNVMCIPFNAGSNYESNSLIKMGASLVENSDDVIGNM